MIPIQPAALIDETGLDEEWCVALGIHRPHGDCCEFELPLERGYVLWFDTETFDFYVNNTGSTICRWIANIRTRSRLCHLLIALGAATLTSEANRE